MKWRTDWVSDRSPLLIGIPCLHCNRWIYCPKQDHSIGCGRNVNVCLQGYEYDRNGPARKHETEVLGIWQDQHGVVWILEGGSDSTLG